MNKKKKKKDIKGCTASARPAEATGTRGFTLTNSYKHEAAYTLQKRDSVLKQHRDSGERDQTGMFTAVEYCSEDNMDGQAFTGV